MGKLIFDNRTFYHIALDDYKQRNEELLQFIETNADTLTKEALFQKIYKLEMNDSINHFMFNQTRRKYKMETAFFKDKITSHINAQRKFSKELLFKCFYPHMWHDSDPNLLDVNEVITVVKERLKFLKHYLS